MVIWNDKDQVITFLRKFLPVLPLERNYTKQNQEISETTLLKKAGLNPNGATVKCLKKILETESRFFKEFKGSRNSKLIHLTETGIILKNVIVKPDDMLSDTYS